MCDAEPFRHLKVCTVMNKLTSVGLTQVHSNYNIFLLAIVTLGVLSRAREPSVLFC